MAAAALAFANLRRGLSISEWFVMLANSSVVIFCKLSPINDE